MFSKLKFTKNMQISLKRASFQEIFDKKFAYLVHF